MNCKAANPLRGHFQLVDNPAEMDQSFHARGLTRPVLEALMLTLLSTRSLLNFSA